MVFAQHLQRFFYFDSMAKYNFAHGQIIASKTARFPRVETELPIQTVQVPQQSNSVDCGIFTLIFTDIPFRRSNCALLICWMEVKVGF